jgi:hypothetical protein
MNLYFVHAHNLHYTEVIDRELGGPSYNDGGFGEYVYAETRGKAKSLVFKQQQRQWSHLEWTDLRIETVHRNVGKAQGIASVYTDRLAAQACGMPEEEWPEVSA